MALRKTSDVGKIGKQSSERFGLPCTAVVVLDRKMSALATTPEAEDGTKIRSPAAPCQEVAVKNDAGGVKFYAPEWVFDRKSSLQMLGILPLFVPAKSGEKPLLTDVFACYGRPNAAPGAYSRVCKQTGPCAHAFSPSSA